MTRDQAIHRLQEHRSALRSLGVARAALLRSGSHRDSNSDDELDVMVEFDPAAHVGMYGYAEIAEYIRNVFAATVEVTHREALTYNHQERALEDAVYAF